jgi:hypothetical protein
MLNYQEYINEKLNIAPVTKERLDKITHSIRDEKSIKIYKNKYTELLISRDKIDSTDYKEIGSFDTLKDAIRFKGENYQKQTVLYSMFLAVELMDLFGYKKLEELFSGGFELFDPSSIYNKGELTIIIDTTDYFNAIQEYNRLELYKKMQEDAKKRMQKNEKEQMMKDLCGRLSYSVTEKLNISPVTKERLSKLTDKLHKDNKIRLYQSKDREIIVSEEIIDSRKFSEFKSFNKIEDALTYLDSYTKGKTTPVVYSMLMAEEMRDALNYKSINDLFDNGFVMFDPLTINNNYISIVCTEEEYINAMLYYTMNKRDLNVSVKQPMANGGLSEKLNIKPITKDRLGRLKDNLGIHIYQDHYGECLISREEVKNSRFTEVAKVSDLSDVLNWIEEYDPTAAIYSIHLVKDLIEEFGYSSLEDAFENFAVSCFDPSDASDVITVIEDMENYERAMKNAK